MTVVDTVFKALAPAIPDRVIAGHHADLRHRHHSTASIRARASSSSAASGRSAAAGAPSAPRTASPRPCASTTATRTTARTSRRGEIPDGGRAAIALSPRFRRRRAPSRRARHRARGAGALAPSRSTRQIDRAHCKPWGLEGGLEATGNAGRAPRRRRSGRPISPTPRRWSLISSRATRSACARAAGGGYGDPLGAPGRGGAEDVRQGYVSVEGGGGAVWRRDRSRDVCGRSRCNRNLTKHTSAGARRRS